MGDTPVPSAAYVLVAHGSRDVRSQTALTQLADLFRRTLDDQQTPAQVFTATLEFGPPLAQHLQDIGTQLIANQVQDLKILPLFLLPGVHAMVDIPEAVAIAQQTLGSALQLTVYPYLGAHRQMLALIRDRITAYPPQSWILMAHGSRYPGGNQAITTLADHLNATPAFWAVAPSLETTIETLATQGHEKIGIFPYFLFTGSITDAIVATMNPLRLRFTKQALTLISPLDPTPSLVQLLMTLS